MNFVEETAQLDSVIVKQILKRWFPMQFPIWNGINQVGSKLDFATATWTLNPKFPLYKGISSWLTAIETYQLLIHTSQLATFTVLP